MDLRLRLYWVDERLVAPPGSLPPSNGSDYRVFGSLSLGNGYGPPNAVWTPDIFFVSEVQPQVFDEVIKIVPDTGSVFWSRHFLVQLTNLFNLEQFPFDSQNLLMQLSSYSYNQDQLTLDWYIGGAVFPELTPQTFTQPIWDYVGYTTSKSTYIQHNGGVPYESISLNMVVRRKSTSYYIKTFLPLFLLVALTSVSYWLSIEAVPERLGLTITLVLTIGEILALGRSSSGKRSTKSSLSPNLQCRSTVRSPKASRWSTTPRTSTGTSLSPLSSPFSLFWKSPPSTTLSGG